MQEQKSLETWSREIMDGFEMFKQGLENRASEIRRNLEEVSVVLKEAAAKGDISENAEYQSAEKELAMGNAALMSLSSQLKRIYNLVNNKDYYPISMVVMYATVQIHNSLGENYIFQLYPEGVSDISRHILAKDSRVGSLLWMKKKGDTFVTEHRITGERITWTVDDIY